MGFSKCSIRRLPFGCCLRVRCMSVSCISFFTFSLALTLIFQFGGRCHPFGGFNPNKSEMTSNDQKLQQKIEELQEKVINSVMFFPLKDLRFQNKPKEGHMWFMSHFDESFEDESGFSYFPSKASKWRILCVKGRDMRDGSKNRYALAWRDYLLPNSTLVPGLTFISENYWDYTNLWHSLNALGPFLLWNKNHESAKIERFVLYHKGEIVSKMGSWISKVLRSTVGYEVHVDMLNYGDRQPVCFEKSLVSRHGFDRFTAQKRSKVMDIIRQKARQFCNVTNNMEGQTKAFNFTLLTRTGSRSFKNESVVSFVFEKECRKVPGCQFRSVKVDGLSFCDQVHIMSKTQVLATVYGAQMTNMVFMEKGSHILEMVPKGFTMFAGRGLYVYHWLADWTGMKHEGVWHDTEGPDCPGQKKGNVHCFFFFKNRQVGYNQTALAMWSESVLRKVAASSSSAN